MELYNFLVSATDGTTLQVRVDALCKGRVFGESLTLSMLHTIMEALQNAKDGDFTRDIGLINEEVRILEDSRAVNRRKRTYGIHLLLSKTKLPSPAKMLIATGFLQAPLQAASRAAPSKFTLTEEFVDGAGTVWTWAPYSAEAWHGSYK